MDELRNQTVSTLAQQVSNEQSSRSAIKSTRLQEMVIILHLQYIS
jgi:hypothetical protein